MCVNVKDLILPFFERKITSFQSCYIYYKAYPITHITNLLMTNNNRARNLSCISLIMHINYSNTLIRELSTLFVHITSNLRSLLRTLIKPTQELLFNIHKYSNHIIFSRAANDDKQKR